ncbi:Chain A, Sialidase [Trypanosoma theileri]|uniref:Chain A, Sialidase n=1 Tax=Trypanosoma theileri TaxID=67003 RepID=A0A1X0NWS6_9TRYP|nr:Chain A, Sialidase [Trypanosoma theileri]ORC89157.1 Chain A, Sialidase [Trypanosoma theileri]
MSHRVVFVLFLLLCCHSSWLIYAQTISGREESRTMLFKQGESKVPFEEKNGRIVERKVHSFRIPSLIDVDGVMVAIADARYDDSNDNSFIETLSAHSVDDGKTWTTQIAIKNNRVSTTNSRVVDPTVIVKDKKIFVFVGSYNTSDNYWQWHAGKDWDPLLVVGEVSKTNENGKVKATIKWSKPKRVNYGNPPEFRGSPMEQFLGGTGVAIVIQNGTLVYPIQVKNKRGQFFSTIMYSKDDGETWKIASGLTQVGCTEPVILEWEGKLILNARTDSGYRKVFESTDMGETWVEAVGTLSRVWGNSPTREGPGSQSSFIPVTIEGKRVMLFTHPLNFKGKWERDRLHLWLTDNNRIFDVGQISVGDENAAYSSLLYKNDKLYCLHEVNHNERYSLAFLELKEELNLIKSVVKTWIDQDNNFSSICSSTEPKLVAPCEKRCDASFPTAGLVGFLSDKVNNNHWRDAYRCVDAEIAHAEKVPNGLRFKGGYGGGARWPVSKQGQNQRYHFVNHVFTLVATVKIDEQPPETRVPVPLLGVSMDESDYYKVLGLSYTHDMKWNPIYGKLYCLSTGSWELNKTYQVVLSVKENVGSIYIDGRLLGGSRRELKHRTLTTDVSHFYIGGYKNRHVKSDSRVTVTNVFLYNRELSQGEINTLLLNKDTDVAAIKKKPTEGNVSPPQREEDKPGAETRQKRSTDGTSSSNNIGTAVDAARDGDDMRNDVRSETPESKNEEPPKNTIGGAHESTATPTETTDQMECMFSSYLNGELDSLICDGSFYFVPRLPLLALLGSTLIVALF